MNSTAQSKKIIYSNAGYFLIGLIIIALVGFWNSYFSKIFGSLEEYNGYFHFHAITAVLWIAVVITQPMLIRSRKWQLHRRIGIVGHVVMALFFVSAILLTHFQDARNESLILMTVFVPFKDLLVITVMYAIGMRYRKTIGIHARAMIGTGIVFIEPALIRAIRNIFPGLEYPYLWTIGIVYLIIIILIIKGRKIKPGSWVFPLLLGMYIIIHSILIFRIKIGFFESMVQWFLDLPLT